MTPLITHTAFRPGWRQRAHAAFGFLSGAGSVGSSVLVAGLCTYLYLSIAGRVLGPHEFAPISTLWAMTFIVGPGLFLPMQQELGRVLASRRGERDGGDPTTKVLAISAALLAVVVVGTGALSPWLTQELFAGRWLFFVYFEVAVVGYSLTYVARGVLSGLGEFGDLGRLIVAEAFARLILGACLVIAGVQDSAGYGAAIAVAPFVAVAAVTRFGRSLHMPRGPQASWADLTRALGWLLIGSLMAQVVANGGPIVVQVLAPSDKQGEAGRFLAALVIARISLYLFQAIQATLLPNLSALLAENRFDELRGAIRRLAAASAVLVVVSSVGAFLVGPSVVSLLFGDDFAVGRATMALLAGASAVFVLAAALSSAAIAASGHRVNAMAWLLGSLAFLAATFASDDLFRRVELGYLAGSCTVAGVLLVAVPRLIRPPVHEPVVAVNPSAFDS